MFRISSLSTVALGLAAIGSATGPAAALSPADVLAGARHATAASAPVHSTAPAASAGILPSNQTAHPPLIVPQTLPSVGPKGPVAGSGLSPAPHPYPLIIPQGVPSAGPKSPIVSTGILPPMGPKSPAPGPQPVPGSGTPAGPAKDPTPGPVVTAPPVDDVCSTNPSKCLPKPPGGPIAILTPRVQVPVPFQVRMPTGTGAVAVQAKPAIVSQNCDAAATVPPLAAGIDALLPSARLSEADMGRVTSLRQTIQELSADGKEAAARDAEEIAMNLLGYQKVWVSCGVGFNWVRQATSAEAPQSR